LRSLNLYELYVLSKSTTSNFERLNKFSAISMNRSSTFKLRDNEWNVFNSMMRILVESCENICLYDGFYLSYHIPQISKEFDLIKINSKLIVNIEMKQSINDEKKVLGQLKRSQYYLSHLQSEINIILYINDTETFYFLKDGKLRLVKPKNVIDILVKLPDPDSTDIDILFAPSKFLVSPINNTFEFLSGNYFLTSEQEKNKKDIVERVIDNKSYLFHILRASAGTGKTLLLFDIAKRLSETGNVCLIHVGLLSEGHCIIDSEMENLTVRAVKGIQIGYLLSFDYILVDEAHRLYENQYNLLVQCAEEYKKKIIFAIDKRQTLSKSEGRVDIDSRLKKIKNSYEYTMDGKIRTNREIGSFIKNIFDLTKTNPNECYHNITITYAHDWNDAKRIADYLVKEGYELITYTPSLYITTKYDNFKGFKTTHNVIGQEFDNVVTYITKDFRYEGNYLVCDLNRSPNPDHILSQLLYQAITRVRNKLSIIVIENVEVFDKMLSILENG